MGYRNDMAPKGGIAPCLGIAGMAEKALRDGGYCSDAVAISRDKAPLSSAIRDLGNPLTGVP